MVDRDVLSSRLSALAGYLAELRAFQRYDRSTFVAEPAIHHLAERFLHLACECVLDIAQHIISDHGYRQANSYRDSMEVLREAGLLDPDLARRLQDWMGFRNVLVHLYLEIDHGRAYDAIQQDLGSLERFAESVASLLAE